MNKTLSNTDAPQTQAALDEIVAYLKQPERTSKEAAAFTVERLTALGCHLEKQLYAARQQKP